MRDALRSAMNDEITQEPVWRTFLGAFRELPAWQKAAIGVIAVVTAPFSFLVLGVTVVSMFPFFLFGRWEGDGDQSLVHEVTLAAHDARKHTEEVYAR